MRIHSPVALFFWLLVPTISRADSSYQETTQMTGGSLLEMIKFAGAFSSQAKQATAPVTSTVAIHGNQMVRANSRETQIIDLDRQTITYIDNQKHQYSVVTFAQVQETLNRVSGQLKQAKSQPSATPDASSPDLSFSAQMHSTGAVKSISGYDAKETVMTVAMNATSKDASQAQGSLTTTMDMWLITDVPGYAEMRSFNMRLAQKLRANIDSSAMVSMLASQPGASEAMANLRKEMAKMDGIPVLQIMKMGAAESGRADAVNSAKSSDSDAAEATTPASLFRSILKRKPPTVKVENGTASVSGTLLETSTLLSNFSAAPANLSMFEVPAGYKLVESQLGRK
jgi:hypothetical protein